MSASADQTRVLVLLDGRGLRLDGVALWAEDFVVWRCPSREVLLRGYEPVAKRALKALERRGLVTRDRHGIFSRVAG